MTLFLLWNTTKIFWRICPYVLSIKWKSMGFVLSLNDKKTVEKFFKISSFVFHRIQVLQIWTNKRFILIFLWNIFCFYLWCPFNVISSLDLNIKYVYVTCVCCDLEGCLCAIGFAPDGKVFCPFPWFHRKASRVFLFPSSLAGSGSERYHNTTHTVPQPSLIPLTPWKCHK